MDDLRYGGKVTRRVVVVVCLMIVVVELFGRGFSFFGGPCSMGGLGGLGGLGDGEVVWSGSSLGVQVVWE